LIEHWDCLLAGTFGVAFASPRGATTELERYDSTR
jgi:hypothetical protein